MELEFWVSEFDFDFKFIIYLLVKKKPWMKINFLNKIVDFKIFFIDNFGKNKLFLFKYIFLGNNINLILYVILFFYNKLNKFWKTLNIHDY